MGLKKPISALAKAVALCFMGIAFASFSNHKTNLKRTRPLTDTGKVGAANWPKTFGLGRTATTAEIAALDIDIRPDGKGFPPGSGTAVEGELIFAAKCASCHGAGGREVPNLKLPAPALVSDTIFVKRKGNTIGNYWPYSTTIFDYIRRTMPYNAPGSLTDKEVYSITAYLLNANQIISKQHIINAQTLPKVVMPARKFYVRDNRKGGKAIK